MRPFPSPHPANAPALDRLIAQFARLPGMGPRSARRAVLRLLADPAGRMLPLASALREAAEQVRPCGICRNLDGTDPCAICADPRRDQGLVCVVESVADVWALERGQVHRGTYHVLGGVLSALGGITPEDLAVRPLLGRLEAGGVREVILATGATVDGATTAHYLAGRLEAFGVTVSRLGQGLPMGGALEILDDGTLAAALKARRPV